jgi:hypothetical protein
MWDSCEYIEDSAVNSQHGVILRLKQVCCRTSHAESRVQHKHFKEHSVFPDLTIEFCVKYMARNIGALFAAALWDGE